MADAVCEGELQSNNNKHVADMMYELRNMKAYHYEIKIEDVLKEILKVAEYAWTRDKIPIVTSIQLIRDNARKEKYLTERDKWKKDREGNEKYIWRSTSIEHGGEICKAKSIKIKII